MRIFLDFDVGMKNSEAFAEELLNVISMRRDIPLGDSINVLELKLIWEQISDDNFGSRLRIFFDMILFALFFFLSI